MRFEFATAGRVIFGPGTLAQVPEIVVGMGKRILLVTGRRTKAAGRLQAALAEKKVTAEVFQVSHEPTTDLINDAVSATGREQFDAVVSLGGGSVIDAGKAIAAMMVNPGSLFDYLEVVGRGHPLSKPPLPFVAIPTTAGAGTEATRNAVLLSSEHQVKVSLRSSWLLPKVAVVDPELTVELPPDLTASTGADALTQLIEPYLSTRANPFTDVLCLDGMRRVSRSLLRVWKDGADLEARSDMSLAALYGGMALANAGLGAVHGFAGPIGGMFKAPHGAVCAALLPAVMDLNFRALRERAPQSLVLGRFDVIAATLSGNREAGAQEGIEWVRHLFASINIPPLRQYGITEKDIPTISRKAAAASSMKGNPIPLTDPELAGILQRCL